MYIYIYIYIYNVGNANGRNQGGEIQLAITHRLFPEKQKGCHKRNRGTGELLYIDQHILKESQMRWKNLAMVWIDYNIASDMVRQTWIIDGQKCTR